MPDPYQTIGANWKTEFEKYMISKTYYEVSASIGYASSYPTLAVIQHTYGSLTAFITGIPIPETHPKSITKRKEMLSSMDEIGLILFGNVKDPRVIASMNKYGIKTRIVRHGIGYISLLDNLPVLVNKMRDILVEAGTFTTSVGLRLQIPDKQILGLQRILDEEGFEDLVLDGEKKEEKDGSKVKA